MKTFFIFGYRITIQEPNYDPYHLPHSTRARRKMADRLDKAINDWYEMSPGGRVSTKIERIKWMRKLTGADLLRCKNWIEEAFDDNGSGKVL